MVDAPTETKISAVLDNGGPNQVTIYSTEIKHYLRKTIINILAPTSSSNWNSGPKQTKIVDLLRIEERYQLSGFVDGYLNLQKFNNVIKAGGTVLLAITTTETFNGTTTTYSDSYAVNLDATDDTFNPRTNGSQVERPVTFTCIVGVNLS